MIELVLFMGLVAIILPTFLYTRAEDQQIEEASSAGAMVAQLTNGVRAYMSAQGPDMLNAVGCVAGALCEQNGTAWLKNSTDCPAATGALTEPFLPCGYPNLINGRPVTVHLFRRGDENHAVIRLGQFTDQDGQVRVDLGLAAAQTANSTVTGLAMSTVSGGGPTYPALNPAAGAFINHYIYEAGGAWIYNPATEAPQPVNGELVAEANSAPSLDAWLRTDGSNVMRGDLDMNGNDLLNVGSLQIDEITVQDLTVTGDMTAPDLILTNVNGGARVSTFWSGSSNFTGFGPGGAAIVNKPICTGPANTPDGVFLPLKVVYYPDDNAGTAGAQIGDISAQAARLVTVTASTWRVEVDVASINAPDPSVAVSLNETNSEVAGIVMTRCI